MMVLYALRAERARARLEELREAIEAESISYGELAELAELVAYIDPSDVVLLEWAGVPEFPDAEPCRWWHAFGVWRHLVCLTHGEGIHEDRAFIRSTPHEVGMPLEACRYNHD